MGSSANDTDTVKGKQSDKLLHLLILSVTWRDEHRNSIFLDEAIIELPPEKDRPLVVFVFALVG